MIPRLKADLRISDLLALWPGNNPYSDIRAFEEAFAELAMQKYAIAFPYGRTAQMALLNALDLKRRQVICPSYTCVVVPHAIVKSGHVPVFADIGEGYNMNWDHVRAATGPDTGAVLATSIFGHPVDADALATYRKEHPDVVILQDCAHGYFAGDMHREGAAAFFGMNISKILTSIHGGMVTTDDAALAEAVRTQRQLMLSEVSSARGFKKSLYLCAVLLAFNPIIYGIVNRLERLGVLNKFTKYYDENVITLPPDAYEWMSGVEARIGLRQCARYHDIVKHRRIIAQIYHEELAGVVGLTLPPQHGGMTVSHFYILTENADQVEVYCLKRGVQLGRLIEYEIPDMPAYQNAAYFGDRFSRGVYRRALNLPVHVGVSEKQAIRIARLVKKAVAEQSLTTPANVAPPHAIGG